MRQCEVISSMSNRYDYTPRTEGDLTFKKDDRMIILDKRNGGWWKARNLSTNIEGYIPMNYVADEKSLEAQKLAFFTIFATLRGNFYCDMIILMLI